MLLGAHLARLPAWGAPCEGSQHAHTALIMHAGWCSTGTGFELGDGGRCCALPAIRQLLLGPHPLHTVSNENWVFFPESSTKAMSQAEGAQPRAGGSVLAGNIHARVWCQFLLYFSCKATQANPGSPGPQDWGQPHRAPPGRSEPLGSSRLPPAGWEQRLSLCIGTQHQF